MLLNSSLNMIPVEVQANINDPSLHFMVNSSPFFVKVYQRFDNYAL